MNRRQFLKLSGTSALGLGALVILSPLPKSKPDQEIKGQHVLVTNAHIDGNLIIRPGHSATITNNIFTGGKGIRADTA